MENCMHLSTHTSPDDSGLINGLQAISSWQVFLNHPRGAILGLYAATLFLPPIVTAYIGDFISARYGRRVALAIGSFLAFAGAIINAFATNPGMWIAGMIQFPTLVLRFVNLRLGRIVIGGGSGISKVAAPALIQEIAHPRLRPMVASCYYPFFYFGSMLSALLCCTS
jgi:MFS family permease